MKHFIYFFFLIGFAISHAQSDFYSEGLGVTKGDLDQKAFAKDSTANALVIYEVGKSYVDQETFKLHTEINRKIKILNRNGFEHGELSIYLYDNNEGRKEKVENIKANVYNIENGSIVNTKLDKNAIYEEQYNDNYTIVKVAFPNVQEGSVINYSYTLISPFFFKYKGWNFQEDIPKLYSEYNASIPGNWQYNIKLVGGQKLTTNISDIEKYCLHVSGGGSANCAVYKYVMKDIPAFIEEDYMTTRQNYLARIEYELATFTSFTGVKDNITKTWKSTDKEIEREMDIGKQLKKVNAVKGLLSEDIVTENDQLTKAKRIFSYVQENFAWNEEYRVLNDISLKETIKTGSGSVGNINTILHNLLVANGIDAKPILISTRNNGLITKIYPVISEFNYLIVKAEIDGKTYLLDATDDYLSFGQIPFRCLNQYGRLLDFDNGSQWYDLNIDDYSVMQYRYQLELDENQEIKGSVSYGSRGYHALSDKKKYLNNPTAIDEFTNSFSSVDISAFEIVNTEKTGEQFNSKFQVNITPDAVANTIYVDPFLFKFFSKNPFKLQERSYPIDFGFKDSFSYRIQLKVDDTYEIKELPKAQKIDLDTNKGSMVMTCQQDGNLINIYFKLIFNEAVYGSNYYDGLKKLMANVVDVQKNSLIVLEKKQ